MGLPVKDEAALVELADGIRVSAKAIEEALNGRDTLDNPVRHNADELKRLVALDEAKQEMIQDLEVSKQIVFAIHQPSVPMVSVRLECLEQIRAQLKSVVALLDDMLE